MLRFRLARREVIRSLQESLELDYEAAFQAVSFAEQWLAEAQADSV